MSAPPVIHVAGMLIVCFDVSTTTCPVSPSTQLSACNVTAPVPVSTHLLYIS